MKGAAAAVAATLLLSPLALATAHADDPVQCQGRGVNMHCTFEDTGDQTNCDSHWYNTCPPCRDLRNEPFGAQQPVLPCDHDNYQ